MPTNLPRPKRKRPVQSQTAVKPTPFARLLNTFMIGTVLVLFAVVLLQEKRYADGEPGSVADVLVQKAQAAIGDTGAQTGTGASN